MIAPETTEKPLDESQFAQRAGMSRYSLIFGATLAVVTVVAVLVAFFASDFSPRGSDAVPASWTQVYNADLTSGNDGAWDETTGCTHTERGLDAVSQSSIAAHCVFIPSAQQSVTAKGFYFKTELAPAAKIPGYAVYVISVGDIGPNGSSSGNVVHFAVGQDGSYVLCSSPCSASSGSLYQQGGLADWHGDPLLTNTLAIKESPDHATLSIFVNDQQIKSISLQVVPQPVIAVGSASANEAIFTHATLYAGD